MMFKITRFMVLGLVLCLVGPVAAFSAGAKVKYVASITGNKDIGLFGIPGGIFFDENKDRLYLTDSTHGRVLAYGSDFQYISEFTGGGALSSPTSVVKDGKGRFFLAEPNKGRVLFIDMVQKIERPLDFSAVPKANPVYPGHMAVDSADNVYVVDKANQRVLVFDTNLQFKRRVAIPGRGLNDVKVDRDGNVYTVNMLDGLVCVHDSQGKLKLKFGKRGKGRGEFSFPVSLAVGKGLIYVVDRHKNKVLVFNSKGGFLFNFSELGWREGRLHLPSYIVMNEAGRMFIIDRQNARVSVFE
ncbi:MAG: NHL repeat-containing protein [Thermodesulfobacteriota bacterium]|nr:NHL repeat-containing protein [Thermodesulfobacteriota bacterium]